MRADCRFAHDLHNITCKYWLEGECLKGESCEFLHDLVPNIAGSSFNSTSNDFGAPESFHSSSTTETSKRKSKKEAKKQQFNLDTSEFPELGSLGSKNSQCVSTSKQQVDQSPINTVPNTVESLIPTCSSSSNSNNQGESCSLVNTAKNSNSVKSGTSASASGTNSNSGSSSVSKKSRKFKDNVLVSFSLPALAGGGSHRKKNIN